LSAAHMLEFLGENAGAAKLRAACEQPSAGTTSQVGDEIAARVAGK
jgi:3-isopropylmalate dehydrogenase